MSIKMRFFIYLLLLTLIHVSLQQTDANKVTSDVKDVAAKAKKSGKEGRNKKINDEVVETSSEAPPPPSGDTDRTEQQGGNQPVRSRLRDKLLRSYDKNIHPVELHTDKVKVDLGLALIHLNLEEKTSILEVDAWLRLNWKDQFLTWNSSEFEGLDQIHFGADEIWRPDVQLYNNADNGQSGNYGDHRTHFLVFNTGEVLWVPPAKFRAFCKINLKMWPLEAQNCKMKFGSWTSHGDQIDLGLYRNSTSVERLNFYTLNKEWEVVSTVASRNQAKYECCKEIYPDVTFEFLLQRRSPLYKCAMILPCLITMLLVVASFLLPPAAGEKILINCTCFIVCVLYLLYFAESLPAMADQVPLIVLFYSNTAALVGIAIVLNVCCISITRDKRYTSPPRRVRDLFSGLLGKVLCIGNYSQQVSKTHQRLIVEMDSISESPESDQASTQGVEEGRKQQEWMLVAAGLERLFFILYTVVFAIITTHYV